MTAARTTARSAAADPYCRNCGAVTSGSYCAACGQETRVALPTARMFMREATGRVLAWDSRLWRTLYALAFRPGFLTKAYLAGRRRYYVRPGRLFLAMSLILFAVIRFEIGTTDTSKMIIVDNVDKSMKPAPPPSARTPPWGAPKITIDVDDDMNLLIGGGDSYPVRELRERFNRFNKLALAEKSERLVDGALRYGSYGLFALLPVFAALLTLSYIGRARRYPGRPKLYAEHLVYAAHLHTFWFLILIVALIVPWQPVRFALGLWVLFYIWRSQRNVYSGGWGGRTVRSLFVAFAYTVAVGLGIVGLVLVSILLR